MTDAEISRRLALAIGWNARALRQCPAIGSIQAKTPLEYARGYVWRRFDYREPSVIWPIAERFDCFPWLVAPNARDPWASKLGLTTEHADTAAKAVALAVIAAKEEA